MKNQSNKPKASDFKSGAMGCLVLLAAMALFLAAGWLILYVFGIVGFAEHGFAG